MQKLTKHKEEKVNAIKKSHRIIHLNILVNFGIVKCSKRDHTLMNPSVIPDQDIHRIFFLLIDLKAI